MRPTELTLDEILADPITRQLMRRDGVEEREIRDIFAGLLQRRAGPRPRSAVGPNGLAENSARHGQAW